MQHVPNDPHHVTIRPSRLIDEINPCLDRSAATRWMLVLPSEHHQQNVIIWICLYKNRIQSLFLNLQQRQQLLIKFLEIKNILILTTKIRNSSNTVRMIKQPSQLLTRKLIFLFQNSNTLAWNIVYSLM